MRKFNMLAGIAMSVVTAPVVAQYAQPVEPAPQAYPAADRYEQMLWDGAARKNTPDAYQTYLRRYPDGPHSEQARQALGGQGYGRAPAYPQQSAAPAYPPRYPGYPPQNGYPQPQQAPAGYGQQPGYPPAETAAPQAYRQPEPAAAPAPGYAPQPEPPVAAQQAEGAPEAPAAPAAAAPGRDPDFQAIPEVAPVGQVGIPGAVRPIVTRAAPGLRCRPATASGATFELAGEAEIAAYLQALRSNSLAAYKGFLQAHPHGVFAPAVTELVTTREARAKTLAAATVAGPTQAHAHAVVTVSPADYPQGVTQTGTATAIWEVAEDGCAQSCRIEKSSGSPALDAATCRVISTRASYEPARDSAGKPIPSIETGTFSWAR